MQSLFRPVVPESHQRLIALDPGRRDVVFGSVHGSKETVKLSTGQLCHDSGRRWSKKYSDFSKIQNTTLQQAKVAWPSSKILCWENFLMSYIPLLQPTLNTWKKKQFRIILVLWEAG